MKNILPINMDAFSDGQIASKLWLCDGVEEFFKGKSAGKVWIYGAWYGVLAFLLLSRNQLHVKEIHLFDIDSEAIEVSKKLLDHWKFSKQVKVFYHHHDVSQKKVDLEPPDLLINTSVEHFFNYQWWDTIPQGTYYALQATNMVHSEHINPIADIKDFSEKMGLKSSPEVEGVKDFVYPAFSFSRFMLMGIK